MIIHPILLIIIVTVSSYIILISIHILQNGRRVWDGRSADKILGIPAEQATASDMERLSKSDIRQLFYASNAPDFTSMKGEYRAKMLSVGILSLAESFYAHTLMGPGHWEAKAFFPFEKDRGWGYNLFSNEKNVKKRIVRVMKMDTYCGNSRFDKKDSFHLVYKSYNRGRNHSMRDEIRKINDELYIAYGCLAWNLDTINPSPFILYGKADPWVGPDNAKE